MRSYIYEIVFILCLPTHILNIGLKFEGIVDLGPKWDYIYKLTPINKNVFNSNELLRSGNRNKIKNYITEDNANIESKNFDKSLEIDSNGTSFEMPYINKEIQEYKNDLEEQHDLIYKEILKHDKLRQVLNNSTKKRKSKVTKRKSSNQFKLRNENIDKNLNRDKNNDANDMETKTVTTREKNSPKDEKQFDENTNKGITKDSLRNKKRDDNKLKDSPQTKAFVFHIFKQSLKIFDKMEKMTAVDKLKRKINILRNSYVEEFSNYLNETSNHKLKTKLANRNVILNTLDTSNYFLRILVNNLGNNEDGYNIETTDIIKMFDKEIQRENEIEHKHACSKLAICRTNNEFSDFISDLLHIILQTNNDKIKQVANAVTEVVKTTDLTDVIDYETQGKLRKLMDKIETWEPFLIRSMFSMFRTVIMHRNQPIVIMYKSDVKLANRTVTFYDLIDVLNKIMGTVENKLEWKDMKKKMEDWRDGKGNDMQKVLERLIQQIMNEIDKLDLDQKDNVRFIMKTLLKSR